MNDTFRKDKDHDLSSKSSGSPVDVSMIEHQSPPAGFVTTRKPLSSSTGDVDYMDLKFQGILNTMITKMESLFNKQEERLAAFGEKFTEINDSLQFISDRYDSLTKVSQETQLRIKTLEEKADINDSHDVRILELETKIDAMEQQARLTNIEISNIPEKRGENLTVLVKKIGEAIKQPLSPQDITAIHRVQKASSVNDKNPRPKNIIVKLNSRVLRDNFLAAARMHKGLTTEAIGIPGNSQAIYINEHLTLKNKILFREARETAKRNGYKFVWPKHGSILVRAKETAPVFVVRSSKDIEQKMKPLQPVK